ncbi:MAG: BON domain-containing protein [Pirellulaceae bacterium]|nr:BON domain-containing protein [Pirellulaceae bacterium]
MTIREDRVGLEDKVEKALQLNPYLTRNGLRCETNQGRVILRGEVNSYFQKQMATETLRKLRGIEEIDNQLEVNSE